MNSKFLDFVNPFLRYVDSGKFFRQPFKVLYYLLGISAFILPCLFIKGLSDAGRYLSAGGYFCFILLILLWIVVAYMVFLIWVKRAKKLKFENQGEQSFIAIPLLSNFVQVIGEALGVIVGIGGVLTVLLCLLFGCYYLELPIDINFGWLILLPISGYLCVLVFRFMSESFVALASVANNTESINKSIKKTEEDS